MEYYGTRWPITTAIVPLTYLRLGLPSIDILVRLISTPSLSNTLHQLHVKVSNSIFNTHAPISTTNLSIRMVNLHTFTLVQKFFSELTIEWTVFETLTSSLPLFTDHRHVDVDFTFNLIDCPQYIKITQYIPRGHRFHPREIVGATFIVNHWSERSEWLTDGDPFRRGRQYHHHMWYTLPWAFDEFFHEYVPYRCITKIQVFEAPSQKMTTINQSSLRTLDASSQKIAVTYMLFTLCGTIRLH
ncbi:unnamed protein product [Rotaria sp. Silwood2]|nr:unnamed protein product [Rotaria sp. Silwood2]CAF4124558.1 unnamed protein product [Rotaria sp. Silwood2]